MTSRFLQFSFHTLLLLICDQLNGLSSYEVLTKNFCEFYRNPVIQCNSDCNITILILFCLLFNEYLSFRYCLFDICIYQLHLRLNFIVHHLSKPVEKINLAENNVSAIIYVRYLFLSRKSIKISSAESKISRSFFYIHHIHVQFFLCHLTSCVPPVNSGTL